MAETGVSRAQRPVAAVVLLVVGLLSLPVVAAFLDGESTDHLIVPVQLASMAVVGAVVGHALPGLAGGTSRTRGALTGVVAGVVAGLVGVAVFFLLLGGT